MWAGHETSYIDSLGLQRTWLPSFYPSCFHGYHPLFYSCCHGYHPSFYSCYQGKPGTVGIQGPPGIPGPEVSNHGYMRFGPITLLYLVPRHSHMCTHLKRHCILGALFHFFIRTGGWSNSVKFETAWSEFTASTKNSNMNWACCVHKALLLST